MKAGQKKSLEKWGNDVFSQFKRKVKSHNVVDFCSSRRMRRLAKKKGHSDASIDASRNYVRDFENFIDNQKKIGETKMTQQEREDIMREFNAELEIERGKKHGEIERAYTMKVEAINSTLSAEIAGLEIERDKAQEEMMCAKIAWINADTDERKTAMQVNFERVRFEQEKICRHIRARIDELKRVAKVDILKATNERDSLNRQLAGQLTEKYNAKVRSLKDEEVRI